jgi:hypothetical protein
MKTQKYFPNNYFDGVKTNKMKNVRFTGRRIEASESPLYKGREAL